MTITVLTGPSGAGKSRYLIEAVNSARAEGRRVSTFMGKDAIAKSANANVWSHGKIGCREPGLECPLDHLVSLPECTAILRDLPSGTLAAFDEARFFEPGIATAWIEASQRGLNLLISTPSPEQVAVLGTRAAEKRLTATCRRCRGAAATSTFVLPGELDSISVCHACDLELTGQARVEILARLERQAPYPGEKALYQPIELEECASWRVLRVDSARRRELMRNVIGEVGSRDGVRLSTYIDVGCNTGYFCRAAAQLGLVSQGLDLVEDDITVARLLSSFIGRDSCRYVVADVHDYLRETRSDPIDIISAFSVIQWLILQRSVDHGLEALAWLFEKTGRICFLEMGYASEDIYAGKLPPELDREWTRRVMDECRQFEEVRCYEASEYGLMRDLFVGFKSPSAPMRNVASIAGEVRTRPDGAGDVDEVDGLAQSVIPALRQLFKPEVREAAFRTLEQYGFHVTPVDFYQPIPDTRTLDEELWQHTSELVGIDLNTEMQLELLTQQFPRFRKEYDALPHEQPPTAERFYLTNGMFDGTDALAYYCMIRHFQPRRIVEVGSGFSTRLAAEAALQNGATSVIAVDPHPGEVVSRGFDGLTVLEQLCVEKLELAFFDQLDANDVLFIDSSHVTKVGGDVNFLFLEVLPRLKPGVIVHLHDIFLPAGYPRDWVLEKGRFWSEQYLLQAFLTFNDTWEVLLANFYLGSEHRGALKETFPNSPWWGGGSFWMRRKLR